MTLEYIGLLTIMLGLLTLHKGPDFGIYVLSALVLLGMAAAVKLPALGGSSIQPVHAFLPFYILAVYLEKGSVLRILRVVSYPNAGFWLLLFGIYGVLSALLLPRIFAGGLDVFVKSFDLEGGVHYILGPLAPSTSNITQAVYMLGNVGVFIGLSVHMMSRSPLLLVRAFLWAANLNILFAVLDITTRITGTDFLLAFIRNANYSLLTSGDISGFIRIVGSFPEASSFGFTTLMLFVFSAEIWRRGLYSGWAGVTALFSGILVLFSTSSSTYVGLAAYGVIWGGRSFWLLAKGRGLPSDVISLLVLPLLVLLGLGLALFPAVSDAVMGLIDRVIINKLYSSSGIERASWTASGILVFWETYGLGAGVGSVLVSSFPVALLANVGIIGTLLYLAFATKLVRNFIENARYAGDPVVFAAGYVVLVGLFPAIVAGTSVDLGLLYFMFLPLAAARSSSFGHLDKLTPFTKRFE